ncbi:MAG: glycosyltransferase family 2 protein [Gemmatimonadaceae bacterium]
MIASFLLAQSIALIVLIFRLLPGRRRRPPIAPIPGGYGVASETVSVIVTSLNEARRITPCLEGLHAQGKPLVEVIVVDSRSCDGTREIVEQMVTRDDRFRLVTDPPLPPDWIGKVWALQHGLHEARGEWILGVDADTEPQPGMVAGALRAAVEEGYDIVSFSPCFAGQTASEQWLQPAMLLTLVYRFGAAGRKAPPADRVMANGQCFLARRDILLRHGGYEVARRSFCDDVTLARHYAGLGAKVGFLDGSRLFFVRAYDSIGQMWREWGRSLDLQDAASPVRQWADVIFLFLVQALPLFVLLGFASGMIALGGGVSLALFGVNLSILVTRVLMLFALRESYATLGVTFWLSPLADPLAALRILLSTVRRPTGWRGRIYALKTSGASPQAPTS